MNIPQVSILIPVYNRSQFIAECIQSALDQSFTNHEIVVVDNASNDGTWEICQRLAISDKRIRIFRNDENIGPVRNWVRCAQEARGVYSKILFSDDLLEPDCVGRMLQPFDSTEVGLVFCAARIGLTKEKSIITYTVKKDSLIDKKKYLSLIMNHQAPVSPGAVMLRTKDLTMNLHTNIPTCTPQPFDQHGAGPDIMIMLLTAKSYSKVVCISDPLVFFRAHSGSFSILNLNNEVSMGYRAAKSYYLRKNESWFLWINFIACSWLSDVKRIKSWVNPKIFLRTNEGHGSLFEMFVVMALTPFLILRKLSKSLRMKNFGKLTNKL
jgi:glycosyltransferase involved in cell wall biosynthesis